ncbi:amidohydrolase [Tamlana sp. 2_MG-2023]|uniref:amidohydrolase n=1 Tax=unclassified Tamlana TaxID=2614803 RepID=UPI0026E16AF2|nr:MULTISPECIES: amidohydrolase [unclassified Tamlana]MDO6760619.1 amidohydrolase [Tamlana sp. 2_MG-2023]MDO6790875.1 amidohydrolase [Tamlana sp. 1_MG-2023]
MQKELKVTWIQADLAWEDPQQNRINFSEKIENLSEATDLIILPEMFSSGFTMNAEKVAETMQGETVTWMKEMAKKQDAAITGSLVISENGNFYNRLLFVEPSGKISVYNKRHTFTLVGEEQTYSAGTKKLIVDYKGWKICPLVCYDLRFPVWARNTEDYDVLLYVANWPKPRISAWDVLLKARAIENMAYCIGLNRVGVDGVNSVYSGHSAAYDVLGNGISEITPNQEQVKTVTLEKRHIEAYRNKFKFLNDRDQFSIT